MKPDLLEASKTWARISWTTLDSLPPGVERYTPVESWVCPVCDTPLAFLIYPPTRKRPLYLAGCFCEPCNLGVYGELGLHHTGGGRLRDQEWAARSAWLNYQTVIDEIERDLAGYVAARNARFSA